MYTVNFLFESLNYKFDKVSGDIIVIVLKLSLKTEKKSPKTTVKRHFFKILTGNF